MLPQAHRLLHNQDFQTVYQKGKRRHTDYLTLIALCHQSDAELFLSGNFSESATITSPPPTRIGIVTSKKVSKSAVKRNLIKRRIRAALQELLRQMAPNWDIVIVVKPAAQECKYGDFLQQLKKLLANLEVWSDGT
jgi:ribonuclease P protein component